MKNYAVIGLCPVCSQGRLIVARDLDSGVLYVLCEECESEWDSPSDCSISAATRDTHGHSELLDREELAGHPWQDLLP